MYLAVNKIDSLIVFHFFFRTCGALKCKNEGGKQPDLNSCLLSILAVFPHHLCGKGRKQNTGQVLKSALGFISFYF